MRWVRSNVHLSLDLPTLLLPKITCYSLRIDSIVIFIRFLKLRLSFFEALVLPPHQNLGI